jgi:xanthine dehydrogenase accessory factor
MVVGQEEFHGTIGGGELEFQALARAQQMLGSGQAGQWVENFPLGEKLGQCCGGSASLLFESFVPTTIDVYLFGAGHVGRALAPLLATLPVRLRWVDTRVQEFPRELPLGVLAEHPEDPCDTVAAARPGSYFLVMTHQHPLDFALMEAALRRDDAAYIGVIGSQSKWRRFKLRLEHRGYTPQVIETVQCPVGLASIPGKRPAEIAVSIAAALIQHYHAHRADLADAIGPGWKQLQARLSESATTFDNPEDTTVAQQQ